MSPRDYPYHCSYGNGEEIEDHVIDHIRACMWNNAVPLKMFPGDVIILNNLLCQHSRMGFQQQRKDGGEETRRVVVSLLEPISRYENGNDLVMRY